MAMHTLKSTNPAKCALNSLLLITRPLNATDHASFIQSVKLLTHILVDGEPVSDPAECSSAVPGNTKDRDTLCFYR